MLRDPFGAAGSDIASHVEVTISCQLDCKGMSSSSSLAVVRKHHLNISTPSKQFARSTWDVPYNSCTAIAAGGDAGGGGSSACQMPATSGPSPIYLLFNSKCYMPCIPSTPYNPWLSHLAPEGQSLRRNQQNRFLHFLSPGRAVSTRVPCNQAKGNWWQT